MFNVSLPYKYNHPLMDEVQQFNINYDSQKNNFGKLIRFVEQFPHKRINISLASPADLEDIKVINKIHNNIYLKFDNLSFLSKIEEKDNFKYYFSFPIGSFTQLNQIFEFPITDIYISDDLCYSLKTVKEMCGARNINTRLIVNTIPSIGIKGFSIKDPIFRPDDAEYISNFIDTIEFDCDNDWKKIEVLYKVWVKQQIWFGNLQEINSAINFYFPNKTIMDILYKEKFNCDLVCAKGGVCDVCERVLKLALAADEQNLLYKKQNERN